MAANPNRIELLIGPKDITRKPKGNVRFFDLNPLSGAIRAKLAAHPQIKQHFLEVKDGPPNYREIHFKPSTPPSVIEKAVETIIDGDCLKNGAI